MMESIFLVGLDYELVKRIAHKCSIKLDRHFLDVNALIEYSLVDTEKLKSVCGVEYFENEQKKIIKSLNGYENVLISFPYSLLLSDEYYEYIKNSNIVFLEIDKQTLNKTNKSRPNENNLSIELLAYDEFTKTLKDRANVIFKAKNEDEFVSKIESFIYNS
ncbi:MAG: hypothetical protein IJW25_01500 [Clostridia bacterium]|nr:hypothetical protein [Clostridia bacterium]